MGLLGARLRKVNLNPTIEPQSENRICPWSPRPRSIPGGGHASRGISFIGGDTMRRRTLVRGGAQVCAEPPRGHTRRCPHPVGPAPTPTPSAPTARPGSTPASTGGGADPLGALGTAPHWGRGWGARGSVTRKSGRCSASPPGIQTGPQQRGRRPLPSGSWQGLVPRAPLLCLLCGRTSSSASVLPLGVGGREEGFCILTSLSV